MDRRQTRWRLWLTCARALDGLRRLLFGSVLPTALLDGPCVASVNMMSRAVRPRQILGGPNKDVEVLAAELSDLSLVVF